MIALLALTAVLAGCLTPDAEARVRRGRRHSEREPFTQQGLAVSVGIGSVGFDSNVPDFGPDESGPGITLGLSYGLSHQVTLFGNLTGSGFESDSNDDRGAGYADLGVKFSFVGSRRQRTQPYVSAAVGGVVYDNGLGRDYEGGAFRLAGGIDHFVSRQTLLFLEAGFWSGQFEEMRIDSRDYDLYDEPDFSSAAIMFGLRFKL